MNEKYGKRAVLEFSSVKDELLYIRRGKYGPVETGSQGLCTVSYTQTSWHYDGFGCGIKFRFVGDGADRLFVRKWQAEFAAQQSCKQILLALDFAIQDPSLELEMPIL